MADKIYKTSDGEDFTVPKEVFDQIRTETRSAAHKSSTDDFIKQLKDAIEIPDKAQGLKPRELGALIAEEIKKQFDTQKAESDKKIEETGKVSTVDIETRVAEMLAEQKKELATEKEQSAMKVFKSEILATAIANDLNPKQKIAFGAYLDEYFDVKYQDGKAVAYNKEDDVLVIDGPAGIEKIIKTNHPEAYNTIQAGAGAGRINGAAKLPPKERDLSQGSIALMTQGIDELPEVEKLSREI